MARHPSNEFRPRDGVLACIVDLIWAVIGRGPTAPDGAWECQADTPLSRAVAA
jgi:hypothetical protein